MKRIILILVGLATTTFSNGQNYFFSQKVSISMIDSLDKIEKYLNQMVYDPNHKNPAYWISPHYVVIEEAYRLNKDKVCLIIFSDTDMSGGDYLIVFSDEGKELSRMKIGYRKEDAFDEWIMISRIDSNGINSLYIERNFSNTNHDTIIRVNQYEKKYRINNNGEIKLKENIHEGQKREYPITSFMRLNEKDLKIYSQKSLLLMIEEIQYKKMTTIEKDNFRMISEFVQKQFGQRPTKNKRH